MKQGKSRYVTKIRKSPLQSSQVEPLRNVFETIWNFFVLNVCNSFIIITSQLGRQSENKLLCCSFTNRKNTNRQVKGLSCVHAHACSHSLPLNKRNKEAGEKSLSNHQSQTRKPVVYSYIGFVLRSWRHSRVKLAWVACVGPWVPPRKGLNDSTLRSYLKTHTQRLCLYVLNSSASVLEFRGNGSIWVLEEAFFQGRSEKYLACSILGEKGNS